MSTLEAEAAGAAELLAARAWLYELAHKCFGGEPDRALLAQLCGPRTRAAVAAYAQDCEQMAGLAKLLEKLAAKDAACVLDAAHDEYTRVFEGPGALPAPPYRAPYTGSRDAALFQEATLDVRALYRAQGLRMRREQAIPDDHVAALLDFAARRAARCSTRLLWAMPVSQTRPARSMRWFAGIWPTGLENMRGLCATRARDRKRSCIRSCLRRLQRLPR